MLQTSLLMLLSLAGTQDARVPRPYGEMPDVRQPAPAVNTAFPVSAGRPEGVAPRPDTEASPRDRERQLRDTFRAPAGAALHFDVDAEGRHYVLAASYKASFGPEGATFVPYFGSDAPQSFPVRFDVAAVAQGGEPVALGQEAGARQDVDRQGFQRMGERFVLDHGALRSEYVVMPAGLEQLFVVDAPLGAGDLVLDLALESELVPRPNGAGWLFEGAHGAVSYGAAFVLDAAGARLDLPTERTAGGLRFTVPAAFLDGAAWPIAIDPFITNFDVDLDPKDQLEVDVAYDPVTDRYLVAFEEVFSAGDSDIKTWAIDTNGVVLAGSDRYIDFTFVHRTRPRVAMTFTHRNFLVVYVEGAAGARRIGACPRDADFDSIGSHFVVDEGSAVDRFEADVCGDTYAASSVAAHYTVVWRRYWNANDSDVVARVVNEDGTFVTSEVYVTNIIGVSDEQPSISECLAPATDHSIVVWRRATGSPNTWTIHAAMLDFGGAVTTSEYQLSAGANLSNPQVSGLSYATLPAHPGSLTYVACWERDFSTDSDIEAVVVAAFASPPAVSSVVNVSFSEHVDLFLDHVSPDVVSLGDRWVITQSAVYPGYTDYVTRATTLNIVGDTLGISERFLALTGTFEETLTPKSASRHESGDANELGLLTAWIQQASFGQQGNVHGGVHTGGDPNTCAAQLQFCYGSPNNSFPDSRSFLMVEGDSSTVSDKRLVASDMTYNAFGYFLASLTVQTGGGVFPPGSSGRLCLGGSIGRYSGSIQNSGSSGTFALVISPQTISQPTGPVAAVAGQTWFFQAWHRDVTLGGAASSNFTNAVALPFQ